MNFRKSRPAEQPEINLIPFIDVLLVILIFLMVTTTYDRYSELQINLPTAVADDKVERHAELVVAVDAAGNIALNRERVPFESASQLSLLLEKKAGSAPKDELVVIISADGSARHQRVVDVLEAARMAGLTRLTFATVREE